MKVTYTIDVIGDLWQPGHTTTATVRIPDGGVRTDNAQVGAVDEILQVALIAREQLHDFASISDRQIVRQEVDEINEGRDAEGFNVMRVRTRRTTLEYFSEEGQ